MDKPIWVPDESRVNKSNMKSFIDFVHRNYDDAIDDYPKLYHWSIESPSGFWSAVREFTGIEFTGKYKSILAGDDIRSARWFEGAKLNFAENLLRYKDDKTAIIYKSENTETIHISYYELFDQVKRCANRLREFGIVKGDRVAGYITNSPEAVIAMLASASIGAVWTSCSPDFGYKGAHERFEQVAPKVLFAVNGYVYNGKKYNRLDTVEQLLRNIEAIEKVILIDKIGEEQTSDDNCFINWNDFINITAEQLEFEKFPFDHPLYIMYSSGTTGKPKCIVHGAGGTLIQHLKELILHTDLKREDVITFYTTCGWMMWNWLVSSLAVGAAVYLYNGSPSYPNLDILFDEIDKEKISVFGTSPKFISACESSNLAPKNTHSLASLKTILSTGAPLSDSNYEYVYEKIKSEVQLSSISGGTDIISCFLLGNPMLPVYKGEIQGAGLGMKIETFDDSGKAVINEVGELVCAAPFPSRPIYFWNDEDGSKYNQAYFDHFPGVWRHGDYIKMNRRGGAVIYGRSDATLNRGGVRIGTAEIYGVVEELPQIEDSLVVAKSAGEDSMVILFVVLKDRYVLTGELKNTIESKLKISLSPRHVPDEIIAVNDIPRTLNGKKVELAVRKVIHGKEVSNIDSLANPESLDQFRMLKIISA